eukprot:SAG31_NODE_499_length_14841_cov_7.930471_15_plen_157_part_00
MGAHVSKIVAKGRVRNVWNRNMFRMDKYVFLCFFLCFFVSVCVNLFVVCWVLVRGNAHLSTNHRLYFCYTMWFLLLLAKKMGEINRSLPSTRGANLLGTAIHLLTFILAPTTPGVATAIVVHRICHLGVSILSVQLCLQRLKLPFLLFILNDSVTT